MITPTNQPAFYFPPANGVYEVKPGLMSLQADFANGESDCHIFQFDNQFRKYRENKLRARSESFEKYVCLLPGKKLSVVNRFIVNTLIEQQPEYFSYNEQTSKLHCYLTDEQLAINKDDSLDALAMQLQEDLVVMEIDNNGDGKVIALHLCAPNHWAGQDKIGKDFITTHAPVPGMHRINQRQREINKACLAKGPYVRFAWGLSTDQYLNHHPQPPGYIPAEQWHGRQFNPDKPELFLRIERQTLNGFKKEGLLLFTIRTYFYDVEELNRQQHLQLLNAIDSMNEEVLQYKGLKQDKKKITGWLQGLL